MELAKEKIVKAIKDSLSAMVDLHKGNKRLSVGMLDHAKENINAAIHILINEIKDEEGKF